MFYLTTHSTHFHMVTWRWTYGKGPFRWQESKATAATTWATLFDRMAHTTAFVIPIVDPWLE